MRSLDAFFARREEAGALEDEPFKESGRFRLGGFDDGGESAFEDIPAMTAAVRAAVADPEAFYSRLADLESVAAGEDRLTFRSAFTSKSHNDVVQVDIVRGRRRTRRSVVIIPHWNAHERAYHTMGSVLRWFGFDVYIVTLPHHAGRAADSARQVANDFLNADLGAAIRSVRQAVSDIRTLISWLGGQGYSEISLVGVSLGSCVGSLVTMLEPRLHRSALLLTGGDFAETVWTGRATCHIREEIKAHISLDQLRAIWSIISPSSFVSRYRPKSGRLMIVSGSRDEVVRFNIAKSFVEALRRAGIAVRWKVFPCGHYSLALKPFAAIVVVAVGRFLRKG